MSWNQYFILGTGKSDSRLCHLKISAYSIPKCLCNDGKRDLKRGGLYDNTGVSRLILAGCDAESVQTSQGTIFLHHLILKEINGRFRTPKQLNVTRENQFKYFQGLDEAFSSSRNYQLF